MDTVVTNAPSPTKGRSPTNAPPTLSTVSSRPTGPLARIVVGSILTGLVGAVLLTLVALPGAKEHVITGSAMIAFGSAWAMLAVLSTRLTNRPQQWALVPAAYMGAVGAGLLVFAPDDRTLNVLGWVWPPAVVVLAVWVAIAARRALPSRTRAWLLSPIFAVIALAGVGGGFETVSAAVGSTPTRPGHLYTVNGHRMHLQCTGTGSPTVVLVGGLGEDSASWAWSTADVAPTTRVCTYDRAGQGWSADGVGVPDGVQIATDLHTLLDVAHVPGPYVFAGHSTGGPYAMVFAARYPSQVAGLVLLDSATPRQMTALPSYPAFYAAWRRGSALLPTLARMGLGRIAFRATGHTLPATAAAAERAFAVNARGLRNQRDEFAELPAAYRQAQALNTLGDKPLAVITAAKEQQAGWSTEQDAMARLSHNVVHDTVDASHESLLQDRADSAFSSQAIRAVVRAVRTGAPVTIG